ncbi:MAG: MazG family protein, partial [Pseudohongiellaceae bacterium]
AITDKLIRRHPHVFPEGKLENFGQDQRLSAADVVVKWEAIKQAERQSTAGQQGQSDKSGLLADIPSALPAIERALKIQRRVASVGFDWSSLDPVLAKVQEELQELQQAIGNDDKAAMNEELGDLLFAVVNLARHMDVEPESALRATNRKFVDRFGFMEQALRDEGKQLGELSLDQLDHYWELAKQAER